MATQWFFQDFRAGWLHERKLSDRLRYYLHPLLRFREHCDLTEALGKGHGDVVDYTLVTNCDDAGAETLIGVREQDNLPETGFKLKTDNLCVTEHGRAIKFTGKSEALSQWKPSKIIRKLLAKNAARTIDRLCEHEFDQTLIRYVGTAANAGTFFRNGYAGIANNTGLYPYHVKEIVDDMRERDVPTYDGQNYVCVGTTFALRSLKDQLEALNTYATRAQDKFVLQGEVGKYYGCRFVECNHAMDTRFNTTAGPYSGEAYFFGSDTVMEAIAIPEEIRIDVPGNFRRFQKIAWYMIAGWKIEWADRREATSDPSEARIIKWDTGPDESNSSSASTYSRSYDSYDSESESAGWCFDHDIPDRAGSGAGG